MINQGGFSEPSFSLGRLLGQDMTGMRMRPFYFSSAGFSKPFGS
jgi:hypothetical protein